MSEKPLPDEDQRALIEGRLDVSMLVEAGAGSGKTESLVRRMVAGIAAGACEVEHMAAVTFTRKAAAELRGRFQLALERKLAEEKDPERRRRLQRALGSLEQLFAGTIHSFCARLLRERPVEAGVAPGFVELDETEDEEQRAEAWRAYVARETQKGWAETTQGKKKVKSIVNPLVADLRRDTVVPFLSRWRQHVYRQAMTLLVGARDFAAEERRRAITLNYADLLQRAAWLLREKW